MSTNTSIRGPAGRLTQQSKDAAREVVASSAVENLMRLGYAVRGLVYGFIGVLALQVALDRGGMLADSQGAIATLGKTPIGAVLLYVILLGLIGYSLWGVVRAVFDPFHKGKDLKGIAARVGFGISAGSYAFLAVQTYGLITGGSSAAHNGAQTAQNQQATSSLLSQPWGALVVGIVGAIGALVGLSQIITAFSPAFGHQFRPYVLSSLQLKRIERLGRFGTAARGLVFAIVGMFLVLAAYYHDPSQARGIDGVLASLLHQPFGPWLLGIVALGLIAFGIYSAISGMWLRFRR